MKVMMSCADQPTLCKLDCLRNLPKYLRTGDVDLSVFVS